MGLIEKIEIRRDSFFSWLAELSVQRKVHVVYAAIFSPAYSWWSPPRTGRETVDAGKRILAPGVEDIEKALDDGWLQVARLSSKERRTAHSIITKGGLGAREAESIALASSRKLMVILDDKAARSFAEVMSITYLGTAGLLFQAFVKKNLTLAELEDAVEALSQTIWLSPAVVSDILRKARETDR